jgi:hypothetical protein
VRLGLALGQTAPFFGKVLEHGVGFEAVPGFGAVAVG